jgi:hypothetical protein
VVAKLDCSQSTVTFLPTGLSEDHRLVGALEKVVVFMAPQGGLVFQPLE